MDDEPPDFPSPKSQDTGSAAFSATKSTVPPAATSRGPATIRGEPVGSARILSSKGALVVPAENPEPPAAPGGAPASGLKRLMREASRGENVSPCWPIKGRVKLGPKPGLFRSNGRYPVR